MSTGSEDSSITRLDIWEGKQPELGAAEADPVEQLPPAPAAGQGQPRHPRLGDYLLLRKIGSGGMGRVFKARHEKMERTVAIKMLPADVMRNPEAVRRFRREVKAAAKLFHPNIVTAFDAGDQNGIHYLVMEYVEGSPLSRLIEDHGPLTVDKATDYILQAARGIEYAHSREVVHRDIKPSNLMLTTDGVVKILDMGTARFPGETSADFNLTQSGIIMGTANYMSPEQARDSRRVDHRTDIYSLGCTYHFLLTGQCLYRGENMIQTLLAHAEKPIPKLGEALRDAPPWLDVVFQSMVAKRPEDRQDTMSDLIEELERRSSRYRRIDAVSIFPTSTTTIGTIADRPVADPSAVVGIDLGSSTSSASYASGQRPPAVAVDDRVQSTTPSFIFLDGLNIKVGASALHSFEEDSTAVAEFVKRSVGQSLYPEPLAGSLYPTEVLLALLINKLFADGCRHVNARQAVITVPACFDENDRKSVQDAGYIAGLDAVDILNEPMAAVIDYAESEGLLEEQAEDETQSLLILSLGGGFCDVAVMEVKNRAIAVKASNGDRRLGGRDWDERLVDFVAEEVVKIGAIDPRLDVVLHRQLRRGCEKAKHALTTRQSTRLRFDLKGPVRVNISRERFEELSQDLLDRIRQLILDTLDDSQTTFEDLDVLLLAGGGTQMPMIRSMLSEVSGDAVEVIDLDENAVARGAALYGMQLLARQQGRKPSLSIYDVNNHSLGVVGFDRRQGRECNAVLIPRNTHLPITTKRTFKTKRDEQESVLIQIIQGESDSPKDCASIGTCTIENLPKDLPAGSPVTVEFHYAADGRLTVYVESPTTGYRATREIARSQGLSNVDLQRWREWLETIVLCSDMM